MNKSTFLVALLLLISGFVVAQKYTFLNPTLEFKFSLGTPLLNHKPLRVSYYTKTSKFGSWDKKWKQYNVYDINALPFSAISYDGLNNDLYSYKFEQNIDSTRFESIKWLSDGSKDTIDYNLTLLDTFGRTIYSERTKEYKFDLLSRGGKDGYVDYFSYDSHGNVDSSFHKENGLRLIQTRYKYENQYNSKDWLMYARKYEVDKNNKPIGDRSIWDITRYPNNRIDSLKLPFNQAGGSFPLLKHLSTNTDDNYEVEAWDGIRRYVKQTIKTIGNTTIRKDSSVRFSSPTNLLSTLSDSLIIDSYGNTVYKKLVSDDVGRIGGYTLEYEVNYKSDGTPTSAIYARKGSTGIEINWQKWEFEGNAKPPTTIGTSEILTLQKQLINLYPNPVHSTSWLNVNCEEDLTDRSFQIMNLSGTAVIVGVHDKNSINISNLESGIYFYQLENGKAEKFVVN